MLSAFKLKSTATHTHNPIPDMGFVFFAFCDCDFSPLAIPCTFISAMAARSFGYLVS